jgi:hypothetical protein
MKGGLTLPEFRGRFGVGEEGETQGTAIGTCGSPRLFRMACHKQRILGLFESDSGSQQKSGRGKKNGKQKGRWGNISREGGWMDGWCECGRSRPKYRECVAPANWAHTTAMSTSAAGCALSNAGRANHDRASLSQASGSRHPPSSILPFAFHMTWSRMVVQ